MKIIEIGIDNVHKNRYIFYKYIVSISNLSLCQIEVTNLQELDIYLEGQGGCVLYLGENQTRFPVLLSTSVRNLYVQTAVYTYSLTYTSHCGSQ